MHVKFPALSARFIAVEAQEEIRREVSGALNRAFSARGTTWSMTWGVDPGWIESAPLALNRYAKRIPAASRSPRRFTEASLHSWDD